MTERPAPLAASMREALQGVPGLLCGLIRGAERRARHAPLGWALSLLVAAVSLPLPAFVLFHLDRGFELSDTGYYYVSIFHSDEISMQTTQFAIVWQLLGLPDNIYLHRLMVFALLMGAGAFLALNLSAYVQLHGRRGLIAKPALASFGAGAFSLFYFWWLPDPSYNAVGLAQNGFLLALFFFIARRLRETDTVSVAACVIAGVIGMALVYVRPPTATFLAVAGAILILPASGWRPKHFIRVALAAIIGAVGFVLAISLLVEPIWETLSRIEGGLDRRDVLARPGSLSRSIAQYWGAITTELAGLLTFNPFLLLGGSGIGVMVAASRIASRRNRIAVWLTGAMMACSIVPGITTGVTDWPLGREGWMLLGAVQIKVLVVGVLATLGLEALTLQLHKRDPLPVPSSPRLACLALLVAFAAQFVGTSNAWFHFSLVAFGLVMMTLIIPLVLSRGWVTPSITVAALLMMGTAQTVAMHVANGSPYLLARPLSEQTLPTRVGPGGSILKLDPEAQALITGLQDAGVGINEDGGEPPILLDMTGTVPGATYLTGAKAPGVPWLNWSLPGSQQMFDNAVAALSEDEFDLAWVLYSPDWAHGLNSNAFEQRGRRVPEDYVEMGRARLALLDIEILVLAPRPDADTGAGDVMPETNQP